jgi:hypothetical protein
MAAMCRIRFALALSANVRDGGIVGLLYILESRRTMPVEVSCLRQANVIPLFDEQRVAQLAENTETNALAATINRPAKSQARLPSATR